MPLTLSQQIIWLLVLAIPIACVARTVVFEEIFREPREWCVSRSKGCQRLIQRKFFYLFTCEYCFSHYVTVFFIWLTRFHLLLPDWRGYVIAFFALVFVANTYLNFYGRVRVEIHKEKAVIRSIEKEVSGSVASPADHDGDGDGDGAPHGKTSDLAASARSHA